MAIAIKDERGEYRPGACNIGPEEIARQYLSMVLDGIAVRAEPHP